MKVKGKKKIQRKPTKTPSLKVLVRDLDKVTGGVEDADTTGNSHVVVTMCDCASY